MSMNFYLQANEGVLEKRYPTVMRSPAEDYPSLAEDYDEETDDTGFFVQVAQSTVPTVNMSNSNMMYVLNEILGLDTKEYCGDLEDLQLVHASLVLHSHKGCYWGITASLELVELAIENNWGIYYA